MTLPLLKIIQSPKHYFTLQPNLPLLTDKFFAQAFYAWSNTITNANNEMAEKDESQCTQH